MASSSSVGVRQQLTSSSPETSDPKVDFAPPCPPNCKCCGFERPEMNTEPVIGSLKKLAGHAFIIYGRHTDWASDVAATDGRLKDIVSTLRKTLPKNFPVLVAEGISGEDKQGDVLLFPQGLRVRAGEDREKVKNQGDSGNAVITHPRAVPLAHESRHAFICGHSGRDRRCGICGPELAAKILAFGDPRTHVRLCSHVGGHKFAGNVIVYDMTVADTGDWYGYVTPGNVKRMLDHSARKPFTSGVYQSHWRGRTGMSKEECIEYAASKTQQQRVKMVIGGAVVVAFVVRAVVVLKKSKE
ncbi:hypothetical protein FOZ63_010714 [Perkinsus olseni]|uniref:Uncharacterized protein n=1 Tax=Perkinsus olseni TaxID=32597 RepID=A0A7J6TNV5_PEROL|nr:hypothetical protein FOZ63_010714 [Perkinsus olseni]